MKVPRLIPYYGSKHSIASKYPPPLYPTIVEPFAGSAAYSSFYPDREIILIDKDPIIAGIWDWLTSTTKDEILNLPLIEPDQLVSELDTHQAAKWLIGFWFNPGSSQPRSKMSTFAKEHLKEDSRYYLSYGAGWHKRTRMRVVESIDLIKHWFVVASNYYEYPNEEATWFIDPPYNNKAGSRYKYKSIDYNHLAKWCLSREGQVIVCENHGADWLPFAPLTSMNGQCHDRIEAIYTNTPNWQPPKFIPTKLNRESIADYLRV